MKVNPYQPGKMYKQVPHFNLHLLIEGKHCQCRLSLRESSVCMDATQNRFFTKLNSANQPIAIQQASTQNANQNDVS